MRAFESRVVLITGAAGGIGEALAREFAREGARLVLLDRDGAGVERLAASFEAAGTRALGRACDVTRYEDCTAAVAEAVARFGGVDVAIANAGVSHRSRVEETDPAVLRKVMDVNYFGAVHTAKAALPSVLARQGSIVAVSSVSGFAPLLDRAGYAASKHALHGFFDTLRAETAPQGVHVLLVCPSFTRTGIDRNALGASEGKAPRPWSTVGRIADPAEVARAILEGVRDRRRLVFPSLLGRAAWVVSRLVPRLYERIMVREVGQEA